MTQYRRYAVYYTPPPGSFADFGARWLGWDLAAGQPVAQPLLPGLDLPALTAEPRKYGFHATLKAPFRLAPDQKLDDLRDALVRVTSSLSPVTLSGLRLARLGSFLALVPNENIIPLRILAEKLVIQLDPMRAPLSEAEIRRRNPDRLTDRQRDYLKLWGYPYVQDEFQFHMTLSGALDGSILDRFEQVLKPLLAVVPKPLEIASVSLVGEAEDGRFHMIERVALRSIPSVHRAVTGNNG